MQARKTWFAGLCAFLYLCGSVYTLLSGLSTLGEGREYPYLYPAGLIVLMCAAFFGAVVVCTLCARFRFAEKLSVHPLAASTLEWSLGAVILLTSFGVRMVYIRHFPMAPESDYKTYYEIAQLINRGTLLEDGAGYCDYVSMFPHVYGYSSVLALAMGMFGDSVWVGQVFNIACAVAACFFLWRSAAMLAGRASGLAALALAAFWPSQILYNNFLAAEYLFSAMLLFCLWLFLVLVKADISDGESQIGLLLGHMFLGIALAMTSAIRPMAMLLLISILLYLVPSRAKLPLRPANDLPVSARAMSWGWIRGAVILGAYLFASALMTKSVSFLVDRQLAGGSASFGYNLLVGLNQESFGGWNQADADYLYDALAQTGSAQLAQAACRDLAMQRLKAPLPSLLNLFFHKYSVLWANDDYGSTWNLLFMDQQGTLTQARQTFLYAARNLNNYIYLTVVAFSALGVFLTIHRRGTWAYVPVTVFLGTVAMHLLVENQNRYHFHALYLFALLAAVGLHLLYEECDDYLVRGRAARTRALEEKQAETAAMARIEEAQQYCAQLQQQKMEGQFDMDSALKSGHVRVSVSEAVEKEPEKQAKTLPDKEPENVG